MMVFKRREVEVVDFITPYRVSVSAVRCEVVLGERGGSESLNIWEEKYERGL